MNKKLTLQWLFAAFLISIPLQIVRDQYDPKEKFLGLILFGKFFEEGALPEVKKIDPSRETKYGYDGQFYAQIALRPSLSDPALIDAVDNIGYRAQRIGMPWMAALLGAGQPFWVLQVYAILNLVFFALTIGVLWKSTGFETPKDLLLAISLLLTSGTLVSLSRALTDFPATSLGLFALLATSRWWLAAVILSGSAMVRDASILSFASIPLKNDSIWGDMKRLVMAGFIVCLPVTIWIYSLSLRLPPKNLSGAGILGWPIVGICRKIMTELQKLTPLEFDIVTNAAPANWFELLCPLTILVQAIYLLSKPRLNSKFWRFGIGFTLLTIFLGENVWEELHGYSRICLPLTFSFNLLIHRYEADRSYWGWFLIGNIGLFSILFSVLLRIF